MERLGWTLVRIAKQRWRVGLVCPSNDLDIRGDISLGVPNASGGAAIRDKNTGRNVASPFNEPLCERNAWGRGLDLEGDAKLPGKSERQFVFKPVFPTAVEEIGRCIMVHEHGEYASFLDIGDGWTRNVKHANGSWRRQDRRGGRRPERPAAEQAHQNQDQDTETKATVSHTGVRMSFSLFVVVQPVPPACLTASDFLLTVPV